jgi:hypothetical protein
MDKIIMEIDDKITALRIKEKALDAQIEFIKSKNPYYPVSHIAPKYGPIRKQIRELIEARNVRRKQILKLWGME